MLEVSSDDSVQVKEISRMFFGESKSQSEETLRPRKRKKITCREPGKARAEAPALQKLLLSYSVLPAEVFENHRLREKLGAVHRSALKFFSGR